MQGIVIKNAEILEADPKYINDVYLYVEKFGKSIYYLNGGLNLSIDISMDTMVRSICIE